MKPGVIVAPSASIMTSQFSVFLKFEFPISSITPSFNKILSPGIRGLEWSPDTIVSIFLIKTFIEYPYMSFSLLSFLV